MFSNNFLALRALSISAGLITEAHEVSPAIIDVANKKLWKGVNKRQETVGFCPAGQGTNYKFAPAGGHDNKPIELWSNKVIGEKIDYIHNNPVEEGLVFRAEDYLYSSAADYAGEQGVLENVIVVK